MALRFYINDATGQLSASPLAGAIGEESSQVILYRCNTQLEWQFGAPDLNGIYRPQRKPEDTVFDMGFLPKGQFEGDWTIAIDPATIMRPTAGTGTGYLINEPASYAIGARSLALDGGSGTILAGDYVFVGHFEYLVETGLSGSHILLAFPGLREVVPDNVPVTIDTEAGFYTATFLGDTDAGRALLNTPNGNPADDIFSAAMNGQMTWILPDADPTAPPLTTQLIYATYTNSFAVSGASPSAINNEWTLVAGGSTVTATGSQKLAADLQTSASTINLPASPSVGEVVTVWDFAGASSGHNLTIGRNGQSIDSSASNYVISTDGFYGEFVFVGGGIGWAVAILA